VFDDQGDRIHLAIERDEEPIVRKLRHRAFGHFLVLAENRERFFDIGSGELVGHVYSPDVAVFPRVGVRKRMPLQASQMTMELKGFRVSYRTDAGPTIRMRSSGS